MVNPREMVYDTAVSGMGSDYALNESCEDNIPTRTNFSKVILKTYSTMFNLAKERKRTALMINISRESRERVDGKCDMDIFNFRDYSQMDKQ